jgi:hypothetical protein
VVPKTGRLRVAWAMLIDPFAATPPSRRKTMKKLIVASLLAFAIPAFAKAANDEAKPADKSAKKTTKKAGDKAGDKPADDKKADAPK